jgi:predicted ester cyclase
VIYRIADGKVVERWGLFDNLGLLVQVGALPAPGA